MSKEYKKKDDGVQSKLLGIYTTYRGEFAKITWPGRPELIRKTITVAIVSALFGVYISVLDGLFGAAFSSFVGLLN